jgi:hypothetical protein
MIVGSCAVVAWMHVADLSLRGPFETRGRARASGAAGLRNPAAGEVASHDAPAVERASARFGPATAREVAPDRTILRVWGQPPWLRSPALITRARDPSRTARENQQRPT